MVLAKLTEPRIHVGGSCGPWDTTPSGPGLDATCAAAQSDMPGNLIPQLDCPTARLPCGTTLAYETESGPAENGLWSTGFLFDECFVDDPC